MLPPWIPSNSNINLQAGDRARERREDLTDERRLGDVRVLIADDARVVGDVGVITKVVIDRRAELPGSRGSG